MYQSLKEFYACAEFFPVGRIVPRRILKADRKYSHCFRFASDTWFIRMPKGHLLVSDNMRPNTQGYVIKAHGDFKQKKTLKVKMCPYIQGGETAMVMTANFATLHPENDYVSEIKLLAHINKIVALYS